MLKKSMHILISIVVVMPVCEHAMWSRISRTAGRLWNAARSHPKTAVAASTAATTALGTYYQFAHANTRQRNCINMTPSATGLRHLSSWDFLWQSQNQCAFDVHDPQSIATFTANHIEHIDYDTFKWLMWLYVDACLTFNRVSEEHNLQVAEDDFQITKHDRFPVSDIREFEDIYRFVRFSGRPLIMNLDELSYLNRSVCDRMCGMCEERFLFHEIVDRVGVDTIVRGNLDTPLQEKILAHLNGSQRYKKAVQNATLQYLHEKAGFYDMCLHPGKAFTLWLLVESCQDIRSACVKHITSPYDLSVIPIRNILHFCHMEVSRDFLRDLCEEDPQTVLTPNASNTQEMQCEKMKDICGEKVAWLAFQAISDITQIEHTYPAWLVKDMLQYDTVCQQLKQRIFEWQLHSDENLWLWLATRLPRTLAALPLPELDNYCLRTPTKQHTMVFGEQISGFLFSRVKDLAHDSVDHQRLIESFQQCHREAHNESLKGRYVFFHAQEWRWHMHARVFQQLWQMKYGEQIDAYQFLRFWDKPSQEEMQKEHQVREDIMHNERAGDNRPRILFANAPLFGNLNQIGSCSALYYAQGHDLSKTKTKRGFAELFYSLKLPYGLYEKYKPELEQLAEQHATLNQHGNLLMLSLDKHHVNRMVYPTTSGGPKAYPSIHNASTASKASIVSVLAQKAMAIFSPNSNVNNASTASTAAICSALARKPSTISCEEWRCKEPNTDDDAHKELDLQEFAMPLTREKGGMLDPYYGPRIRAFHPTDPQAYQQWEQELQRVCSKIAADYRSGNYPDVSYDRLHDAQ